MTCAETADWLLARDCFLILTHVRPDGDTIGCAAGLCCALREQGKTACILPNPEASALFTPHLEGLLAQGDYVPRTVVAVDIAAVSLIGENARGYLPQGIHLAVDHHPSQEYFAQKTCLAADRAACGEIIYEIVARWGPVSPTVALHLYLAVSTDTGCFVYGNTTANTHRVAAALMDTGISVTELNKLHFRTKSLKRLKLESMLVNGMELYDDGATAAVSLSLAMLEQVQASEEDIDNISAFVGQIAGIQVAITLRELGKNEWKISLRTSPSQLNASTVCALLGGGGHAAASGATVAGSREHARDQVLQAIQAVRTGSALPRSSIH